MSIADRYLVNLAVRKQKAPDLILLTIVSTLLAAKLEEPLQPSFRKMLRLVQSHWDIEIRLTDVLLLENSICNLLEFSFKC